MCEPLGSYSLQPSENNDLVPGEEVFVGQPASEVRAQFPENRLVGSWLLLTPANG
jgi:hypothetical protein